MFINDSENLCQNVTELASSNVFAMNSSYNCK